MSPASDAKTFVPSFIALTEDPRLEVIRLKKSPLYKLDPVAGVAELAEAGRGRIRERMPPEQGRERERASERASEGGTFISPMQNAMLPAMFKLQRPNEV